MPKDKHGICVPLFSLHSERSGGIGEYLDLLPLIPWCKHIGLSIIQLLPLNDTAGGPSPYSSVSAFALNPIYITLPDPPKELQRLNRTKLVAYEKVWELKNACLKQLFKSFIPNKDYHAFVRRSPWLEGYAKFRAGRGNPAYFYFLQYLCHQQLELVRHEAEKQGIRLKGDIPILINRHSADTHEHPQLFDFSLDAGAPPDAYAKQGQNWGFPLYDWEDQSPEILRWWKRRLQHAENYYHLYRLDHVLGLFRIWGIPRGQPAKTGSFIPPGPESLWYKDGEHRLRYFLKASSMLPIAEDLGTVPPGVRPCLHKLGIPGTKVMRWETIPPCDYPRVSMTTVSTHDTETLWQWFHDEAHEARAFLHVKGKLTLDNYRRLLYLAHHSNSIYHINLLQEYFPLTTGMLWGKPSEERVNTPSRPLKRNWRYRFRPTVEQIIDNDVLARSMRSLY